MILAVAQELRQIGISRKSLIMSNREGFKGQVTAQRKQTGAFSTPRQDIYILNTYLEVIRKGPL